MKLLLKYLALKGAEISITTCLNAVIPVLPTFLQILSELKNLDKLR